MNKKVIIFLTTTFGLTWLMWWLLAFLKIDASQIFNNPMFFILFFIGRIAPTIASYISIKYSDRDYKSFNKAVLKWRINIFYYLFCIASVLGVRYLSIAVYGFLFKPIWTELTPRFIMLLTMIFPMIPMGGLEEFGWRGLLFPELNKKINLIMAALAVGLIWALWHLPLFYINGLYDSSFLEFLLMVIGLGLVLAWLYKKTNSIFICVLFHAMINASSRIGLSCPSDGRYITEVIWLILGGSLLLYEYLTNRKKMKNLTAMVS
jgi:CAAX amino terminal protease family.